MLVRTLRRPYSRADISLFGLSMAGTWWRCRSPVTCTSGTLGWGTSGGGDSGGTAQGGRGGEERVVPRVSGGSGW